jgi:peroxiredoxin
MKNLIITLLLGISGLHVAAQVTTQIRQSTMPLDTSMLVYDEQGNALKYYQYTKLVNSGDYTIKGKGAPGTPGGKMMLVKMPEEQKAMMAEMVKRFASIKSGVLAEGNTLDVKPLMNAIERENFEGKAIVMIFWGVDCPPCTEGFETINGILNDFKNPNLVSIGVTSDNKDDATEKLKQKPLLTTHSLTYAYKVSGVYGIYEFPTYIIADKNHVIKFAMTGSSPFTFPAFKTTLKSVLESK